jgi:hypothetical protein
LRKEDIERYVLEGLLRPRIYDSNIVQSLVKSSIEKAAAAKLLPALDNTASLIFLGLYESIRQLGDAKWRLQGYEAVSHDVSMKILEASEIKEKRLLEKLDRFRRIRNDANYRGQKISVSDVKEIIEFWDLCSEEIIKAIEH